MRKEYDFSKSIKNPYSKDIISSSPIYLEPEIEKFISKLAKKQKKNISEIINSLLLKDKELIELARKV
jgi:hypothetical protein